MFLHLYIPFHYIKETNYLSFVYTISNHKFNTYLVTLQINKSTYHGLFWATKYQTMTLHPTLYHYSQDHFHSSPPTKILDTDGLTCGIKHYQQITRELRICYLFSQQNYRKNSVLSHFRFTPNTAILTVPSIYFYLEARPALIQSTIMPVQFPDD